MLTIVPPPENPRPGKSLREIFNQFAADADHMFPHLKGQIVLLDMNEHRAYGYKNVDEKKTGLTPEGVLNYLQEHNITQAMEKDPNESSCALYDPQVRLNTVFINDRFSKEDVAALPLDKEKHLLMVLDHELAHCAIKNGRSTDNSSYGVLLGETVADAYALIRHYQRFGVESDYGDKYVDPASRAYNFIIGEDTLHFTSFVLAEIIRRKHEIDFDKLTPQQTVELARRFAFDNLPAQPVVTELYREFRDVRDTWRRNWNNGVKALVEKTLDPKSDYFTFRLGSLWLSRLLQERKFPDGTPIKLSAEYLDDAARRLKERELQLAKEDILFNTPIKPKQEKPSAPPQFYGPKAA